MDGFILVAMAIIGITILTMVGFLTFQYFAIKKRSTSLSHRKKIKTVPIGRYMYMFKWYSSFFLTRQGIIKLHRDISALSVYTYVEARILTVKMFNMGLLINISLIVLSALLFHNLIYLLVCLIFAAVMRENFLYKRIDRIRVELMKDELTMLSSLRQEYMRTRSVVEAYESCNRGKYIARATKEIHDSLTALDAEERLEAFSSSTPLPTLQTLASISHIINNRGDSHTPAGVSVFASAIDMIADEVRIGIRREALQKQLFGSLEFIPIVPIVGIVPLEIVFKNMIPGTAAIYDGSMGFVFTLIILGSSLLGYYVVTNATRSNTVKNDDRTAIDKRLMQDRRVRDFVSRIRPRKQSTLNAKYKLIRKALTRNTIDYLYLRKSYMCILTFIVSLILVISYITIGRSAIAANISGSSMTGATTMTDKEREILEIMDTKFLSIYREKPTDDELSVFVKENMPGVRAYEIEDQVKRLGGKYDDFYGLIFQWWMVWLCLALAIFAYFLPEQLLKMRAKIIQSESDEDCLQLQTTVAIMMNTNTDTMDLLEYLYKNSRIFKSILIDCYQNYVADPFMSLRIAKSKTELPEFRNMMDKLSLTVVQITIAEAFSDLVSERDHMLRMREAAQLHSLKTKRELVRPFALAPMVALIGCQFIAPICLLAFSMFTDIMSSGLLNF